MKTLTTSLLRVVLLVALPSLLMVSCAEDLSEPDTAMPDKSKIRNPKASNSATINTFSLPVDNRVWIG